MPPSDGDLFLDFRYTGTALPTGAFARMGVRKDGFAGTDQALADGVAADWNTHIGPWISAFVNVQVALQEWSGGGLIQKAVSSTHTGDITGDAAPPNVAYLVTKQTNLGGRRGKGRWFHPGVPEAATTTGGVLVGSYVAGVPTAFSAFLSALQTDQLELGLSREGPILWEFDDITGLIASQTVATQRRRLRR